MLSHSRHSLLLGLGLLLAGCRAFPVGLYVPAEVLDRLAEPRTVERLDEERVAREVRSLAGSPVEPAPEPGELFQRLDLEPVAGPFESAAFDSAGSAATAGLAAGDLVLVKNGRAQSLGVRLAFAEFTFYDHLGVLVRRDGRWEVCDSWPSFHPFGKSTDFAGRFRGGVRATPLGTFLAHYETLLVVRLPDGPRNAALAAAALASLDEGIEYDPHHDPRDPRLSCSEYLLELLRRAGHPVPAEPRPVAPRADLREVLSALGFPTGGFYVPEQFAELPGTQPVAWISRHRSRAGARAVEVAFELLHERYAEQGTLADYLAIDRFHFLRYRANVELFLRWSEGWAEARGVEDHERLREELGRLVPVFFVEGGVTAPGTSCAPSP